ncbi:hypothetical protein EIN_335570 [Entamoeba invadens IP1]|uniref:Uncharacterized protein n=1 Tax=Entamoeba invadens IP1 TaxID=370355 RepID=L7FNK4_ENTIV|nr:hypothetical protein EIN_335570 [Entamoeba invadens IP1]ELP88575.1 hypothetical protein EIN_335570 [Entamoeba invadens IP1]|eukprot:XP_004255346.1 hypothetical protein EIN_335570 [Entamoeba invadens IP1]
MSDPYLWADSDRIIKQKVTQKLNAPLPDFRWTERGEMINHKKGLDVMASTTDGKYVISRYKHNYNKATYISTTPEYTALGSQLDLEQARFVYNLLLCDKGRCAYDN